MLDKLSPEAANIVILLLAAAGLWVAYQVAKMIAVIVKILAAIGMIFVGLWIAIKASAKVIQGVWWVLRQLARHPRSVVAAALVGAWCYWLGWLSLVITVMLTALGCAVWWHEGRISFDRWVGLRLRSWWLRWTVYAPKLPRWMYACGLTGGKVNRDGQREITVPKIAGVRSGPSWDEVRIKLVDGQTAGDFDAAKRALASSRNVARCQVREIEPRLVSLDFQRHDKLAALIRPKELAELADVDGGSIDLEKVWCGLTEYGTDLFLPFAGSHTLVAAASRAGKNSFTWSPLVSIAPAIRDGYVRVWGIDPKGVELAYGRRVFAEYTDNVDGAIELLRKAVAEMQRRKLEVQGDLRKIQISRECPLNVIEIDELGTLTKYVLDRGKQATIAELLGLLLSQGLALGFMVRAYVQDPRAETVPFRDLFPRRICLRVSSESEAQMVLGELAVERGAWAHRIGESEQGVGYLVIEGQREPLRVRSAWVDDPTIKALEDFVDPRPIKATAARVTALPIAPAAQQQHYDDGEALAA